MIISCCHRSLIYLRPLGPNRSSFNCSQIIISILPLRYFLQSFNKCCDGFGYCSKAANSLCFHDLVLSSEHCGFPNYWSNNYCLLCSLSNRYPFHPDTKPHSLSGDRTQYRRVCEELYPSCKQFCRYRSPSYRHNSHTPGFPLLAVPKYKLGYSSGGYFRRTQLLLLVQGRLLSYDQQIRYQSLGIDQQFVLLLFRDHLQPTQSKIYRSLCEAYSPSISYRYHKRSLSSGHQ